MATSLKAVLPSTARAYGVVHALRRGTTAGELSADEAEELIARARAGKLVTLYLDATTFIQTDAPNRNLTRFKKGSLGKLAKSYVGVPFLRDHRQEDTLARGGRVVASEHVKGEDGSSAFRMTLELTEPWAVESALRGSIDRFSIAWHSTGDLGCSICGEPLALGWFGVESSCEHEPGAEYDGAICQLEFASAEGVEVSAVSVPAVVGTELEGIRASLARSRGHAPQESCMNPKLLVILGLAAAATDDQVFAAVEGLKVKADAELEAHALTRQRLVETQAKLTNYEETALAAGIDREIERGVAEGRFVLKRDKDGARVESAIEKSIRHAGRTGGLAAAKEIVDGFVPGTASPVGARLHAAGADPTPAAGLAVTLTPKEQATARSLGLTAEEFAKHKQELAAAAALDANAQEQRR